MPSNLSFDLSLPDGMPLFVYDLQMQVEKGPSSHLRMSFKLNKVSSEFLEGSGIFPEIRLPEMTPLEQMELSLEIEAQELLYADFPQVFGEENDSVSMILGGPKAANESVSPFRDISNYRLIRWGIETSQLVPDDVLELYKQRSRENREVE